MAGTRLTWARCLIAALVIAPLLGVFGANAQESTPGAAAVSGSITLLAYSGEFRDNYSKAVVEPCAKTLGITVNYQDMNSSANGLATLRTQKDDPQIDVAIMDISIAAIGNTEGIFQPLDPSVVTNLSDLYDEAKTADNFGPSVTFDNFVLIYNKDQVNPAPTSWNALWDPKYAGKVIVTAPPDIQGLALTIITDKLQGADYTKTIDPAIKKLAELAPSVQTFDPQPEQYTIVANGDAALAVGWNARAQLYADQSNGKLGVVLPDEGSIFQKNTINLVKGSHNPAAAQAFINCTLGAEAQQAFSEAMFYAPVNKTVKLPESVLSRTASSPELVAKMIPVDWTYVAKVRDDWLNRWRREVISG
ncbi:MAG TPA: ABC transporter substrate-binding protein [Thermomicrobiales bacterium]|nr:ABC transporter substrate-binding protein [Thermomicrobiales bacterium]